MIDNIKYCKCGCGEQLKNKNNMFIHGHNARGTHHKKTFEQRREMSFRRIGFTVSKETREKIRKTLKGKTYEQLYGKEEAKRQALKRSLGQKGKIVSKETRLKISKAGTKWKPERILKTLEELFEKNSELTKGDIITLGRRRKMCHESCIRKKFGSFDKAAEYVGRKFSHRRNWQKKEQFIGDVLKEIDNTIEQHINHDTFGIPDFENNKMIYDAKSTLNDIRRSQVDKYEKIGKKVFMIPFEMKGTTSLSFKQIIPVTDLINKLPSNVQQDFISRYEVLLNGA